MPWRRSDMPLLPFHGAPRAMPSCLSYANIIFLRHCFAITSLISDDATIIDAPELSIRHHHAITP